MRVLADWISTLRLHVYRPTAEGRQRAGDNARAVQLLQRPSPGSTGVDLISQIMVHLNIHGEAFVGKYRADREIVQLALISPESIQVELRGRRIVYLLDTIKGRTEHGPDDTTRTEKLRYPARRAKQRRVANSARVEQLLDALPTSERAVWALAFYGGLRVGELRALRWDDVDFAAGVIRVQRAWDDL